MKCRKDERGNGIKRNRAVAASEKIKQEILKKTTLFFAIPLYTEGVLFIIK